MMKICMIGGTGLLGSQGAAELISRGHEVKAIALPRCRKVRFCRLKGYGDYYETTSV